MEIHGLFSKMFLSRQKVSPPYLLFAYCSECLEYIILCWTYNQGIVVSFYYGTVWCGVDSRFNIDSIWDIYGCFGISDR